MVTSEWRKPAVAQPYRGGNGRRARDVIPAAIQAEVRTAGLARKQFIAAESGTIPAAAQQRGNRGSVSRRHGDADPELVARIVVHRRHVQLALVTVFHVISADAALLTNDLDDPAITGARALHGHHGAAKIAAVVALGC